MKAMSNHVLSNIEINMTTIVAIVHALPKSDTKAARDSVSEADMDMRATTDFLLPAVYMRTILASLRQEGSRSRDTLNADSSKDLEIRLLQGLGTSTM